MPKAQFHIAMPPIPYINSTGLHATDICPRRAEDEFTIFMQLCLANAVALHYLCRQIRNTSSETCLNFNIIGRHLCNAIGSESLFRERRQISQHPHTRKCSIKEKRHHLRKRRIKRNIKPTEMKLYRHLAKSVFVAAALMLAVSCSNGNAGSNAANTTTADSSANERMIVRYIDGDSLMANYNLAKEINEAMLRRSNQLDNEQQKRGAEITRFGNEIQNKYQNNGYLTQESFNADQAKLQQMQIDAQNYMAKLQRDAQNEMQQYNMQLNDSVENFINDYARQKGFDMIIYKASGVYMDKKYDVTKEVVEGLNKRYTKVEKK